MLRIHPAGGPAGAEAGPVGIVRDFDDPYLELVRLLREAAEIEHALLVQYLYAAFSIKPAYAALRGFGFANSGDMLGVAVQEMQHLEQVNRLLVELRAAPGLVRQDFPYEPDIYPFPLNLEPLSLASTARYVFTEAPARALDPDDPANADPATQAFLARLQGVLGAGVRPNHLGSLYGTIIDRLREVIAAAVPGVGDLSRWEPVLERIKDQGEVDHFRFFRAVFTGTHAAFGGRPDVWALDPGDPDYPAVDLGTNPSAFTGHEHQIADPGHRRIAWLSNLHYWLVLGLLDLAYRTGSPLASVRAKDHMTLAMRPLGTHLAELGVGVPFDPLSMGYAPGADLAGTVLVVRRLAVETAAVAEELRAVLPASFFFEVVQETLAALDTIAPVPVGPGGGNGGPGPGPVPSAPPAQVANDFWFAFDDRFAFNPPPEVQQAMGGLGSMDLIRARYAQRRLAGTYPAAFEADVAPLASALTALSQLQLEVVDAHFGGDVELMRVAFEHFGQGDLFDDRRLPGTRVHMMDSSGPLNPPIGYHRWHVVIRAMTVLGIDTERWQEIDRYVGLAWAIQSEARPRQEAVNPPMAAERLAALRAHWLSRTPDQLDTEFDRSPYPVPVP